MLIRALGASPVAAETTAAARRAGAFGIRRAWLPGIRTLPKTSPQRARLGQSFERELVTRRSIAVCSVLRRGNWNAALTVLNEHLAVAH
jgi:hypothetical protein